jgi:hypothetical protein
MTTRGEKQMRLTTKEECPLPVETAGYPHFGNVVELKVQIDYASAKAIEHLLDRCRTSTVMQEGQLEAHSEDAAWTQAAKWFDENLWPALYGWI